MKNILRVMKYTACINALILSMFILPLNSAPGNGVSLGTDDLNVYYGTGKSLGLFSTQYKNFTGIAGSSGRWEDADKMQYTWEDGQAAFIKTADMKNPQLVLLVLDKNYKTVRGLKKGSTSDEIIKAYSDNYETIETGDGVWYVYRWTVSSTSPLTNGKTFSLSFYIVEDQLNSIMIKLESEDTEGIPVG